MGRAVRPGRATRRAVDRRRVPVYRDLYRAHPTRAALARRARGRADDVLTQRVSQRRRADSAQSGRVDPGSLAAPSHVTGRTGSKARLAWTGHAGAPTGSACLPTATVPSGPPTPCRDRQPRTDGEHRAGPDPRGGQAAQLGRAAPHDPRDGLPRAAPQAQERPLGTVGLDKDSYGHSQFRTAFCHRRHQRLGLPASLRGLPPGGRQTRGYAVARYPSAISGVPRDLGRIGARTPTAHQFAPDLCQARPDRFGSVRIDRRRAHCLAHHSLASPLPTPPPCGRRRPTWQPTSAAGPAMPASQCRERPTRVAATAPPPTTPAAAQISAA